MFLRYCASIFLSKHAVDMINEFLFSLGDFGKKSRKTLEQKFIFQIGIQSRSQSSRYPCPAERENELLWEKSILNLTNRINNWFML